MLPTHKNGGKNHLSVRRIECKVNLENTVCKMR